MRIGDTAYYNVKTGHGSDLLIIFRLTGYYDQPTYGETLPSGDLVVQGFAESIGKAVGFMGLGFLPEIGSHVAVAEKKKKDKHGLSRFVRELVVSVKELTEEQYDKSQQEWLHRKDGEHGEETGEA